MAELKSEFRIIIDAAADIKRVRRYRHVSHVVNHGKQMLKSEAQHTDEIAVKESPSERAIRRPRGIEWGLLYGLLIQTIALVWGAAELTASVKQLNKNMDAMSDYAVLRFRVDSHDREFQSLRAQLQSRR